MQAIYTDLSTECVHYREIALIMGKKSKQCLHIKSRL